MKKYLYEGKNYEDALSHVLEDQNTQEENLIITIKEEKNTLLKKQTIIEVINYNMHSKKQNFIYNSAVKITDLTIKNTKKDFISKFINKIKMRKKLKKHLEKNKYDIILCMAALSNILVAQVRKGIDAKVIGTEHVPYDGHSLKTKIKRRIFYKNLDALVVLTQEDYDKNAKYFKNVSIIYNSPIISIVSDFSLLESSITSYTFFANSLDKHCGSKPLGATDLYISKFNLLFFKIFKRFLYLNIG